MCQRDGNESHGEVYKCLKQTNIRRGNFWQIVKVRKGIATTSKLVQTSGRLSAQQQTEKQSEKKKRKKKTQLNSVEF